MDEFIRVEDGEIIVPAPDKLPALECLARTFANGFYPPVRGDDFVVICDEGARSIIARDKIDGFDDDYLPITTKIDRSIYALRDRWAIQGRDDVFIPSPHPSVAPIFFDGFMPCGHKDLKVTVCDQERS